MYGCAPLPFHNGISPPRGVEVVVLNYKEAIEPAGGRAQNAQRTTMWLPDVKSHFHPACGPTMHNIDCNHMGRLSFGSSPSDFLLASVLGLCLP